MALMGEGATLAFLHPHPAPRIVHVKKKKKRKKKSSGLIINVVYFPAWLFKYFQAAYGLLQGIIVETADNCLFSNADSIPSPLSKEADLKEMSTLNSWLVPSEAQLKLTGHCANLCISKYPHPPTHTHTPFLTYIGLNIHEKKSHKMPFQELV